METLQLLPENILRRQVCDKCFQYLSVPLIMVNSRGEKICGRCVNDSKESNFEAGEYTKSAFNLIAERFLFKCTNHLNGCNKILKLYETKKHEETCIYGKQECLLCSFFGNLSQILNHCLIFHGQNVSFDGKISFFLSDNTFHKSSLLVLNDNIFYAVFNLTEEFFTIELTPVTKKLLPTVNQYGIRFFKHNYPTNIDFIQTDYGLLNKNMETYFKKGKGDLVTFFGLGVKLCCEILMEQFSLTVKEFEIEQRFAKLRISEERVNNSRRELQNLAEKLSQQNDSYNSAMDVIKKMSYDFFKCYSCKKIIFETIYFCPKNHRCCSPCLTNVCKICKSVQEFTRLENIEKFLISCDWPGCKKTIFFKDYVEHKNGCLQRPYKCPLLNCHEVILSVQKLIEHWHCIVPTLTDEQEITCEKNILKEYYWILKNDLYHVLINFDDTVVQVLIDEVNVLPNNISFTCEGFYNNGWHRISSSTFCGKFQIYTYFEFSFITNNSTSSTIWFSTWLYSTSTATS